MKPYSSYKPSGIPWLAPIPTHWETKQAKRLLRKMDRPPRENDKVVTCFRDGTVTLRENRRIEGFTESLQEIGYQGIREGDLVVHNMDAFAGAVGVSDSDGKGTPVYSVCTMTPDANAHYYAATLREMARSQWITALATGIRERSTDFRYATLAQQTLPVPPLDEQVTIVRYLDHADELISRYSSAKERLIALLEEQRQAVIDQAVMRGLDPNVRLKTSGIQWLGDVPQHWKVRKLKQVCSQQGQYGANIPASEYTTSGIRFLRTTDISADGDVVGEGVYIPLNLSPEHILNTGDILLTRSGATVGQSFLYDKERHGKCSFAGYLIRFSPSPEILPKFVYLFTTTARFQNPVQQSAIVSTIENVNAEKYANIHMPIPPFHEQMDIVQHLDELTRQIDTTIAGTGRQIELMGEYRTRLIADAVTGQIDVRNATVELPGEHL